MAATVAIAVLFASPTPAEAQADVKGIWAGYWDSDQTSQYGSLIVFVEDQVGADFSGSLTVKGSTKIETGSLEGQVSGLNMTFGAVMSASGYHVDFSGTLDAYPPSAGGTYAYREIIETGRWDVWRSDRSINGLKLILKRAPSGREKAVFVSTDPFFQFPEGENDPTAVGAKVDLLSPAEGSASFDLPAGNWSVNSTGSVYRFVDKTAPDATSAVRMAILRRGKVLKIVAKDTGLALAGPQASVGIRIQTGLLWNCARFGAGTTVTDEKDKFIARNTSWGGDCTDASLLGSP